MTQASSIQRSRRTALVSLSALVLVLLVALAGCDLFGGGSSSGNNTNNVALSQLAWCDKPLINFQDNSTTNQATLTKWDDVKGQLGFTTYLPTTLPKSSCLVLAGGSIHDPIFGGQFKITYDLPNGVPISFSEAPKRSGVSDKLTCVQGTSGSATQTATPATQTPGSDTSICLGVIANTSIAIASRQSQSDLQNVFKSLQADVDWVPANTTTTPSPTPPVPIGS
ncbi:MAG TPA: hypothetical protein VKQ30_07140 [Ktedonobacterales bacterium]|nr:hypothetical protein [Ktedonobacterales bacterium]